MHFENVSILVNALATMLADMGYCWRDKQGTICMQKGVFRVNCIDCLDRTNVVQTALGKAVMEMQFSKLGLIPPDGILPANIRQTFQLLWANNGDIISKQYAGTNALKVCICLCKVCLKKKIICSKWFLHDLLLFIGRLYAYWGEKIYWADERWHEFRKQVELRIPIFHISYSLNFSHFSFFLFYFQHLTWHEPSQLSCLEDNIPE